CSYLLVWQLAAARYWLSEAECRGASLDQFVYFAGPGDLDPIDEIALFITAGLYARRAGPQAAATRQKILDQGDQRLKWGHYRAVDRALADQIDGSAGQECRHPQSCGHTAIGDRERDRGQFVIGSMRDKEDEFPR